MGRKINSIEEKECLEEISAIVDNMSLMDDELMAKVFDENLPATTLLLSTILQKEIEVESTKGQFDMRSPLIGGRSIRLDVHAKEKNGEHFDCEVQRANEGASFMYMSTFLEFNSFISVIYSFIDTLYHLASSSSA